MNPNPRYDYQGPGDDADRYDTLPLDTDDAPQPLIDVLQDTQALLDVLDDQIREQARRVEALLTERAHIAAVLTTFAAAELSLSSVQPVLELAADMKRRRAC